MKKEETACFYVDCQNGFTPLCPEELPVPEGDQIVPELLAMQSFAAIKLASGDEHPDTALFFATKEKPMFSPAPAGKDMDILWNRHCVTGTFGAELLDGLPAKENYDLYIAKGVDVDKHPYGACYHDLAGTESTGVIEFLRDRGVTTVLVGGLATDYCVKETALQLRAAGFDVTVNLSACRGIAPESTAAACETMEAAGIRLVTHAREIPA